MDSSVESEQKILLYYSGLCLQCLFRHPSRCSVAVLLCISLLYGFRHTVTYWRDIGGCILPDQTVHWQQTGRGYVICHEYVPHHSVMIMRGTQPSAQSWCPESTVKMVS